MSPASSPREQPRAGALGCLLRRDHDSFFLHAAFAVFAIFTFGMAFVHVPWRDEAQPWLFARDLDLSHLFYITRHNGHPMLWFLCVKAVQVTGISYLGMMVLNWAFCLTGVWLLFYRSALPLAARFGLAFAPICYLEIAYTARDYAIAMPLIFLAAIFYRTAQERPLRYAIVLALLGNTNVFAAGVFVGISCQFLLEQACARGTTPFSLRPLFTRYLVANVILALGAVLLVLQLAPIRFPGDTFPNVTSALVPDFKNLFKPFLIVIALASVALLFFRKTPRVIGMLPTLLLISIPVIAYGCSGRHLFMLVLGIVYYCWVYQDAFLETGVWFSSKLSPTSIQLIIVGLIVIPALGLKKDPFNQFFHSPTDARRAARAIIDYSLDQPNTILVSTDSFRPMSLYLFLKNIKDGYVPEKFGASPQSFAHDAYVKNLFAYQYSAEEIKPLVLEVAKNNPGKTIVILSAGVPSYADPKNDDSAYQLTTIYQSPRLPSPRYDDEFYRVFVLNIPEGKR